MPLETNHNKSISYDAIIKNGVVSAFVFDLAIPAGFRFVAFSKSTYTLFSDEGRPFQCDKLSENILFGDVLHLYFLGDARTKSTSTTVIVED